MANEIKLQITKTDGTIDEMLVTPEQYVDMLTSVYKPQVKPAAAQAPQPAFVQPPPAIPQPDMMSPLDMCHAQFDYSNCDGQAGNYNKSSLMSWLGPYAMKAAMQNQMMHQFEDPNEKLKRVLIPVGAGLLGLVVGGCLIGFICSLKSKQD